MKTPNLFTFLDQISNKVERYPYDKKLAPAYMLSMWLAHDPSLISIVQKINHIQFSLPDRLVYQYYLDKVPKRKKRYIKWTKKTPDSKDGKKIVESIKENYRVSTNEAKMIRSFIERRKNG
jgi:hypothetical protein